MQHVAHEQTRQDLLKQLQERLQSRLDEDKAAQVGAFARHFYARRPGRPPSR